MEEFGNTTPNQNRALLNVGKLGSSTNANTVMELPSGFSETLRVSTLKLEGWIWVDEG